ncbi:Rho termination factor N-terminal domain-containing protein [Streptomyces sp. NRRL S-337]|uniref:Rho termination factor N-terminal domain-containing protein n=1 Tax=Streptomyces sp. NRRL S-337 TaxID=1463900 RepID=UPI00131BFC37|nr:Rho termination factor N-terminal domain-containing protein [Streptomyces sp. NRRL S-337]
MEKEAEAPESTDVIELMDVLNAGLNTARGERKATRAKGGKRRTPPSDLEGRSKSELYELATEAGIPGRSSMKRGDLIKALSAKYRRLFGQVPGIRPEWRR